MLYDILLRIYAVYSMFYLVTWAAIPCQHPWCLTASLEHPGQLFYLQPNHHLSPLSVHSPSPRIVMILFSFYP